MERKRSQKYNVMGFLWYSQRQFNEPCNHALTSLIFGFSNMAANNTITDEELRAQLLELGENVGPVTGTTRPLLLRKLKKLQNEGTARAKSSKKDSRRKSTPASPRTRRTPSRKLIGFSSDEETEDTSYKTRRRQSGSRRSVKQEDESLRDNVDGDSEGLGRVNNGDRERGNSTVQSFSSLNESNITDDLSDSERSAYAGPFQRGTFRFRSFRRKRDSPESSKYRAQKENVPPDERSFDTGQDSTDGWYKYEEQKLSRPSFVNSLVLIIVLLCIALLLAYFLEYFPPSRNWITSTTQGKSYINLFCLVFLLFLQLLRLILSDISLSGSIDYVIEFICIMLEIIVYI